MNTNIYQNTDVSKLTFQEFTEKAAQEVYRALQKRYDVRNAVVREVQPMSSSPIVVILVTSQKGLPKDEPCIKKMSQAYLEYDKVYHGNMQAFAKGFAKEVDDFYAYVDPQNKK